MDLPASLYPAAWQGGLLIIAMLGLYLTARRAPWSRLGEATKLHLVLGFAVALTLVWSMKAGVQPGLNLHLLGAMAATLVLGAWLAVVSMSLALLGVLANGGIGLADWPVNFVLMALLPVLIANGIRYLAERVLPAHFFIFVFVVGFAGAALTVMLQGGIAAASLALAGAYPAGFLLEEYLPFFLLLGFSEGWISGAVITLMVVYRPEWVAAFDDRRYLLNK
ncbi:energy-coupling factor ABC transporter permease [Thauera sp. WH-2]|jgi:uncharacterized membrane protein|uniref:energy-coupling factor ABC transporter permease n=1 Tax=unclassified Thauera TaxID=2609274 RepID=UPI003AAC9DE0